MMSTLPAPVWTNSCEDLAHCSRVVQWLLHNRATSAFDPRGAVISPLVMQFWDTPIIPDDVQLCMQTWRNSGIRVHTFNNEQAREFICTHYDRPHSQAYDRCYHPAMKCDYFRLCYLLKWGGCYVDADELYLGSGLQELLQDCRLKLHPLGYNPSIKRMVPRQTMMTDRNPASDTHFYLANSPIITPPGHPVIALALERACRLLHTQVRPPIHGTTGPGNLSAALVQHLSTLQLAGQPWDFEIILHWPAISRHVSHMVYKTDRRNWRHVK